MKFNTNLHQILLAHKKSRNQKIKVYWTQFKLIELIKNEDFEHLLLKILLQQKIFSRKSCFNLNIR